MIRTLESPARRRLSLRFSLRVLLGLITLAAATLGFWKAYIHPYRAQREALDVFQDAGATVGTRPAGPAWIRRLWGANKVQTIVRVDLEGCPVTDECLAWLGRLPDLEEFRLGKPIPGQGAAPAYAESLARVEYLNLNGTPITDEGLRQLTHCSQLQTLFLNRTAVTDAGLRHLHRLPSLRIVWLVDTQATPQGIRELRAALPEAYVGY